MGWCIEMAATNIYQVLDSQLLTQQMFNGVLADMCTGRDLFLICQGATHAYTDYDDTHQFAVLLTKIGSAHGGRLDIEYLPFICFTATNEEIESGEFLDTFRAHVLLEVI